MQTRTAKGQSGSDEDNLLERGLDIKGRVGDPAQMAAKNSVILGGPAAGIWRVQGIGKQEWSLLSVAPELKSNHLLLALNTGVLGRAALVICF